MRNLIELQISDRQFGDTLIRQKATFQSLLHTQAADGTCQATITVLVTMYAAQGPGYGDPLTAAGFATRSEALVADNNCVVHAETGAILADLRGKNQAQRDELVAQLAQQQPTMLQGDFFEYLRDNGLPGTIRQMIAHHIEQADAMGRFA